MHTLPGATLTFQCLHPSQSDLTTGCVCMCVSAVVQYKCTNVAMYQCTSVRKCTSVLLEPLVPGVCSASACFNWIGKSLDRRQWKATLTGWHDRSKCLYETHRRLDIANEQHTSTICRWGDATHFVPALVQPLLHGCLYKRSLVSSSLFPLPHTHTHTRAYRRYKSEKL